MYPTQSKAKKLSREQMSEIQVLVEKACPTHKEESDLFLHPERWAQKLGVRH